MTKLHPPVLFVCLDCGAGIPAGGHCPKHPEEPLFDPSLAEIQDEMEARDTANYRKVTGFWSAVGAIIGFGYGLPASLMLGTVIFGHLAIIIMVAAVLASPCIFFFNYLGKKLAKPRFARFTKARQAELYAFDQDELDELAHTAAMMTGIEVGLDGDFDI